MHENPARLARQAALSHAANVIEMAQTRLDAGAASDPRIELLSAQVLIRERGVPGQPGTAEREAGASERAAILSIIDEALAGAGDPLSRAQVRISQRIQAVLLQ